MGELTSCCKSFALPCLLALAPVAISQDVRATPPPYESCHHGRCAKRTDRTRLARSAGALRSWSRAPLNASGSTERQCHGKRSKAVGCSEARKHNPCIGRASCPSHLWQAAAYMSKLNSSKILWRVHSTISAHRPYRRLPKPSRVPIPNNEFGPFRFLYSQTAMQAEPFSGLISLPNPTQASGIPSSSTSTGKQAIRE